MQLWFKLNGIIKKIKPDKKIMIRL